MYEALNFCFFCFKTKESKKKASKCPYIDGHSVFQARAILSQFDKNLYYDDCPAEDKKSNQRLANNDVNSNKTINNIVVYPNPAKDVLKVNMTINEQEQATISIHGIMGNLIQSQKLSNGTSSIDIAHLSNGVYLYIIEVNSQQVKKDKVVITK